MGIKEIEEIINKMDFMGYIKEVNVLSNEELNARIRLDLIHKIRLDALKGDGVENE